MGQTAEEKAWIIEESGQVFFNKYYADELPRHEICVDGFWMGKFEVTRGQFQRFVQETGHQTEAQTKGKAWVYNAASGWSWKEMRGVDWRNVGYYQNDKHPAVTISWNDATAFVSWLNGKGSGAFRLPTEAEWEYAARAGSTSKWFWGDDPSAACKYGNAADTTAFPGDPGKTWNRKFECSDGYWGTAPVGTYRANAFGLHDMIGNVWEWCADVYDDGAYSKHFRHNPLISDGSSYRVNRGGSWGGTPVGVRSAGRGRLFPDDTFCDLGFRLLRTN